MTGEQVSPARAPIDCECLDYDEVRAEFDRTLDCLARIYVDADSFSAIKHAKVRVIRDDTGLAVDFAVEGDFPCYGNNDDRADALAVGWSRPSWRGSAATRPTGTRCTPGRCSPHLERGLRPPHRQHAGRNTARAGPRH